ncbi:MAG: DUF5335 family protein [Bacteroidales bacterium]|jgi:hypothetical protein
MFEKEKVNSDKWSTYLKSFTDKNRGRLIQVQNMVQEKLYDLTNSDMPFQRISAKSATNGTLITINFGYKQVDHTFVIESPVEIWHEYNYEGQIMAVEILNKQYEKVIILFKSYF